VSAATLSRFLARDADTHEVRFVAAE